MALMAAGLAFTTGPPPRRSWARCRRPRPAPGSAVNDTTREVGGTLGVAIVGSVLNSAYGSHVLSALTKDHAPAALTSAAQQSVVAGLRVAGHLPAGLRDGATEAVRQAFISGLHSGSLVAAAATAAAALITLAFLPARARPVPADTGQPAKAPAPAERNTTDHEMAR